MANVLTKFLVGIGWDKTDYDKGSTEIGRSFSGIKTAALAAGAAIAGALGTAAASVINTANRVDSLYLKTENFKTSTEYVYKLGNALKVLGGDADEAFSAVAGIEEMLTNYRISGDIGALGEIPKAGVDALWLGASRDAEEFLSRLSTQVPGLDEQERQYVQSSLGLSNAAMRGLGMGPSEFDALLHKVRAATGEIGGMEEAARKYNENMALLGLQIEGIRNELTEQTLVPAVEVTEKIINAIDENRGGISGYIKESVESPGLAALRHLTPYGFFELASFLNSDSASIPEMSGSESAADVAEYNKSTGTYSGKIDRSPVVQRNDITLRVDINGQALDSKIIEVTERTSFETLEDLKTTTVR